MKHFPVKKLHDWFMSHSRDLPWRNNKTPYAVFVSEIMLQQTQVERAVKYYIRFLEKFPTVFDLAKSDESEVLLLWEGLGYYSRAINLHKGSQHIVKEHSGIFPKEYAQLLKVPGIGPYTAGAILSFAFDIPTPAVDANVLRVMSRFYSINDVISSSKAQKEINGHVTKLLSIGMIDSMESIIELGALICASPPQCSKCPLHVECKSYNNGTAHLLPVKKPKKKTEYIIENIGLLIHDNYVCVMKPKKSGVLGNLWRFPTIEYCSTMYEDITYLPSKTMETFSYGYTNYKVELRSKYIECHMRKEEEGVAWIAIDDIKSVQMPSGHRKVAHCLKK